MLIKFAVSNFLSFKGREEFSLEAGKARKNSKRIYNHKNAKLTKCEVILGANASGKSNLIEAFKFMQEMVEDGLPLGFSNKYFRQDGTCKDKSSTFETEFICNNKRFAYGFSVMLNNGSIIKEWLYEITATGLKKYLFNRDALKEIFEVGEFFKDKQAIMKLVNYGEDSVNDEDILFITLINKNKGKMYADYPELNILRDVYSWFVDKLNISFPNTILTKYPFFTDANLEEIANILGALGTGISSLKFVELPIESVKSKIPEEVFNRIVSNLEKINAKAKIENIDRNPSITARAYKEFYTFEIDKNDSVSIKTIEFSHENKEVYFNLNEESDGTARLLDLIEILFDISNDKIFIIDEIDRCLHPAMTVKIIELFLNLAERRNTQLIITTHESRLLAAEILRNDEICFVMKTEKGNTIINPLEKYQLRADKKVYAALFDGTLDAIPQINSKKLEKYLVR